MDEEPQGGRTRRILATYAIGAPTVLLLACSPGTFEVAARSLGASASPAGALGASAQTKSALIGNAGAGLIGNAGAGLDAGASGIIAKNSSKFLGTVQAPPGIIAKNSSKYRIAAFEQVPYAGGYVVLLTPDGLLLTDQGRPIYSRTDDLGRYDFGTFRIPPGRDVLVQATFPGNRVLYQYAHSSAGDNKVDVDLAGTYVSAYLVAQGRVKGKPLAEFDRSKLDAIQALTLSALSDGTLGFDPDHLLLGREADLLDSYQRAIRAGSPALDLAWRQLLGAG
jgi:hypothetical protein